MNIQEQIKIIGTNHISLQSLEDIKKEFLGFQPHIVGVELDKQRLASLMQGEQKLSWKAVRILGVRGFFFVLVSRYFQQKLGKMTGSKPGSEMLYAVQLAKQHHLPVALVDRPIDQTIKKLMKSIRFIEIMRFLRDIFMSIWPFGKKKKIKVNIAQVPDEQLIDMLIGELEKKYPSFFSVLIDQRNHYMAKRLVVLAKKEPQKKILCVVGAGHKKGMEKLLTEYDKSIEIV